MVAAGLAALALAAASSWAAPNGVTVWTGKGVVRSGAKELTRFEHMVINRLPNGRTSLIVAEGPLVVSFGGPGPVRPSREFEFTTDLVQMSPHGGQPQAQGLIAASCSVVLRSDLRKVNDVHCTADLSDGSPLDLSFYWDGKTRPGFNSFAKN